MTPVLVTIVVLVAGTAAFFSWANRATARAHAQVQWKDVEAALAEVLAPDSRRTTASISSCRGQLMTCTSNQCGSNACASFGKPTRPRPARI